MKKSNILFAALLFGALALVSCGSDDDAKTGTLDVNFKAYWGNDPVVLNEEVWYFNDETMTFSRLSLFVSNLELVQEGDNELLAEAGFVDFEMSNRTEAGAAEGVTLSYELPVGTYDSFDFGVGVSPELNSRQPADYPNDHPLGQFGSYWTAWNSFIFSKTEGMIDSDGDDKADKAFVYHIGSDNMYRTISAEGPIEIGDGDRTEITVTINFKDVFGSQDDHIDIIEFPTFHSPQDPTLAELTRMLADNYQAAIDVEMK